MSSPVTAWIASSTVAGSPSESPTQVHAREARTASTTSHRISTPKTLNSARPTLPSMNG